MKGFNFENIFEMFDDGFGKKMEQMMGGGLLEGRHNIKLMYIRKNAKGDKPRDLEEENSHDVN